MAPQKPVAKPVAKTAAKPAPTKAVAKAGTAVAPVKKQTTAVAELPDQDHMSMLAQYAGAGLENATAQDYALPFIYLLQSNSPQVDADDEKYVEGASAGMFMNTVTKQLYGDKIRVIPVDFQKVYNEWVPRDAGGGFIKSYDDKAEGEANCAEDHQLVDTANHFVLVETEDEEGETHWEQGILSCTSTKLAMSRNWMSRIAQVLIPAAGGKKVAPSFAKIYEITTERKENAKGKFYVPKVEPVAGNDGWTPQDVFEQALDFREQLKAGQKGADFGKMEEVVGAEVEGDDNPTM